MRSKTILFAGLFLVSASVWAEVGRAGRAGSFLRMGLGSRALAMGGGSVALTDDGYAGHVNPAGLVFLEKRHATTMLNAMALDRRMGYIGYAQSMGGAERKPPAGFSVGWLSASVSDIDARDFGGNDIGTMHASEHAFFFSFAMNPVRRVAVGFTGKVLYHRMPEMKEDGGALSATGFGFDVGILVRPHRRWNVGFSLRDIDSKYSWDTQEVYERGTQTTDRFPQILRFGAAVEILEDRLVATADVEQVVVFRGRLGSGAFRCRGIEPVRVRLGCEWSVLPGACVRAGLYDGSISLGAGYRHGLGKKEVVLDYAYVPDDVAPRGNHVFGWSLVF